MTEPATDGRGSVTNPIPVTQGEELLPCPFCGTDPLIEDGVNDRPWVVQCLNKLCFAQPFMDHADTKRQAIAAWNTRGPAPPAAASEVVREDDPLPWAVKAERAASEAYAEYMGDPDGHDDTSDARRAAAIAIQRIALASLSPAQPEVERDTFAYDEDGNVAGRKMRATPTATHNAEALIEALEASLAKRSMPTMDPPYTAAFNAALDMVARDTAAARSALDSAEVKS